MTNSTWANDTVNIGDTYDLQQTTAIATFFDW